MLQLGEQPFLFNGKVFIKLPGIAKIKPGQTLFFMYNEGHSQVFRLVCGRSDIQFWTNDDFTRHEVDSFARPSSQGPIAGIRQRCGIHNRAPKSLTFWICKLLLWISFWIQKLL